MIVFKIHNSFNYYTHVNELGYMGDIISKCMHLLGTTTIILKPLARQKGFMIIISRLLNLRKTTVKVHYYELFHQQDLHRANP